MQLRTITYFIISVCIMISGTGCQKEAAKVDCHAVVMAHPGYEVWAGDSAYFNLANQYDIYYQISKYSFTRIGGDTKTAHFSTANFKYYVVVAKYYACVDAIRFDDGTYYGDYSVHTLYTGLCDYVKMTGAPDGVYGEFGSKSNCPPPGGSFDETTFNAYVTDDATITSRGGGLTVYIDSTHACQ